MDPDSKMHYSPAVIRCERLAEHFGLKRNFFVLDGFARTFVDQFCDPKKVFGFFIQIRMVLLKSPESVRELRGDERIIKR